MLNLLPSHRGMKIHLRFDLDLMTLTYHLYYRPLPLWPWLTFPDSILKMGIFEFCPCGPDLDPGAPTMTPMSRVPTSGKIRENFYFLESHGKSGNFNIFCRESGKVRENDLADVTKSLSLISSHIFVKTHWLEVQNFSLLRSGFHAILIRSVLRGQGKSGKNAPKCQGKSGNSNIADGWEPCMSDGERMVQISGYTIGEEWWPWPWKFYHFSVNRQSSHKLFQVYRPNSKHDKPLH